MIKENLIHQKKKYFFVETNKTIIFATHFFGRLAQLVQSTWFTPRGSLVRIQYRPQKQPLIILPVSIMRGFFVL